MKRAVALSAIVFLAGCGEGPKHLPKADYDHGKAAFESLEQYNRTSADSFGMAATSQIRQIHNLSLIGALGNYSIALDLRSEAALEGKDVREVLPVVKICRDDAAQYFDASAASTGSCDAELKGVSGQVQIGLFSSGTKREDLRMIDENALRDTLVVLVELVQAQYKLTVAMGTQLQALQETVRGLDPTFAEVMEVRWQEETEANAETRLSVAQVLDDLIQRLKDGEVC